MISLPDSIIGAPKVITAVSVFFVWVVRYENIKKEFESYSFPKWFRDLVGILKISFTVMLQSGNDQIVLIGSFGIVGLMLGAVGTHLKIKNPVMKMLPALSMLFIGLLILLHTLK